MSRYIKRFRKLDSPISMNAIDYYSEDGVIIERKWAMGGESKKEVKTVPENINGYTLIKE